MWGNISGVVGAAIQKVQKIQNDIETQLDNAVGVENNNSSNNNSTSNTSNSFTENRNSNNNIVNSSSNSSSNSISNSISNNDLNNDETEKGSPRPNNSYDEAVINSDNCPPGDSEQDSQQPLKPKSSSQKQLLRRQQNEKNSGATSPISQGTDVVTVAVHEAAIKEIKLKASEKIKTQEAKFKEEIDKLRGECNEFKKRLELETNANEQARSDQSSQLLKQQQDFDAARKRLELELDQEKFHNQQLSRELENERKEISEIRARAAEDQHVDPSDKLSELESLTVQLKDKLKQHEVEAANKYFLLSQETATAKESFSNAEIRIEELTQQLKSFTTFQSQHLEDISKLKEIIKDRERALEGSVEQAAELRRFHEESKQKIMDMKSELTEKEARLRSLQASSADDNDCRKELLRCQDLLREKVERLTAFEEEGKTLAKKQSEMEKNVRKTKQELREKEIELTKLKESKDQLTKSMEHTQEALKKNELEALNTSKTLSAMQAVSQATTDKLSRLEADINAKNEELSSQRRALENAWSDTNELKRLIAELKAERDDMKRQLGEGTSKVLETESSRREIEQREAVLRATSRQLQENLQSQMKDSSAREERLREEIHEMRRKWQEAVSSRETLASELGQATSPMLRQISSLQETLRIKSEQWQNIESSLSERALRAENVVESFEHKKSLLEDQIVNLKQQLSITSSRLQDNQSQLQATETTLERYKRLELAWHEEKHDFESKLSMEVAQKNSLQTSLREMELRHKLDLQDVIEKNNAALSSKEAEIIKLSKDLTNTQGDLKSERAQKGKKSKNNFKEDQPGPEYSNNLDGGKFSNLPNMLPSGDMSFVANEKMQLRNRQKDEELSALLTQLNQLQSSRNALLEEVSFLSSRNSQLEEDTSILPTLRAEHSKSQNQLEIALLLLGEKEEELEAMTMDMKEIKDMYTSHIAELIDKVTTVTPIANLSTPKITRSKPSSSELVIPSPIKKD